jgi:hypothetical protein
MSGSLEEPAPDRGDELPEVAPLAAGRQRRSKRKWTAKAASFVCPGAGQLLERRYLVGSLQLGIFLGCLLTLVVRVVWWIGHCIAVAAAWSENAEGTMQTQPPWQLMAWTFSGAVLVFLWSVWDAGRSEKAAAAAAEPVTGRQEAGPSD